MYSFSFPFLQGLLPSSLTGGSREDSGGEYAGEAVDVRHTVGQINQECKEKCVGHLEKLDLRFLQNRQKHFCFSVTHLILRFTIVQNKF